MQITLSVTTATTTADCTLKGYSEVKQTNGLSWKVTKSDSRPLCSKVQIYSFILKSDATLCDASLM